MLFLIVHCLWPFMPAWLVSTTAIEPLMSPLDLSPTSAHNLAVAFLVWFWTIATFLFMWAPMELNYPPFALFSYGLWSAIIGVAATPTLYTTLLEWAVTGPMLYWGVAWIVAGLWLGLGLFYVIHACRNDNIVWKSQPTVIGQQRWYLSRVAVKQQGSER